MSNERIGFFKVFNRHNRLREYKEAYYPIQRSDHLQNLLKKNEDNVKEKLMDLILNSLILNSLNHFIAKLSFMNATIGRKN